MIESKIDTLSLLNKYPVFIFGAGASVHAGLPLANGILPGILESKNDFGEDGESVEKFLERLGWRLASKRGELATFEEVLSLLDEAISRKEVLSPHFGPKELEEARSSLIRCLEHIMGNPSCEDGSFQPLYSQLISMFAKSHRAIATYTFATLNYDTLLDHALKKVSSVVGHDDYIGFNYAMGTMSRCLSFGEPDSDYEEMELWHGYNSRSPVALLKLHGSINWGRCCRCGQMVGPYRRAWMSREGFRSEVKCPGCKVELDTVIIPPSWVKDYYSHPLSNVWAEARERLIRTELVIFIGCSLAEADQKFRYLLKTALFREAKQWPRIIVIGRKPCQSEDKNRPSETQKRYERFFGEVEYWPIGFEGFVEMLKEDEVQESAGVHAS